MSKVRSLSGWLAAVAVCLGIQVQSPPAIAADMPVKAKPVAAPVPEPLDIHGGLDITAATNRVTGAGFLLYPSGAGLVQINASLAFDLYKSKTGFINSFTVYGGVWNEFFVEGRPLVPAANPFSRAWQEMDVYAGFSVGFAQHWKFSAEYVQFNFPSAIPTAYNSVYTLSYNDAHWGWWFPFNPYVSLFYNMDGNGSTVVFGQAGDTFRVTFGINPTVNLFKETMFPLTLSFPTSVVIAPTDFYNRNDGTTNVCGPANNLPCELSNLGMWTTGIVGKWDLAKVIPKRLGSWYFKAAGHYYRIENDALLAAQVAGGAVATFNDAKKDVVIGTVSFGMGF